MEHKSPKNIRRDKRKLAKALQQELIDDAIIIYRLPPARPRKLK